jgi:hypothetical protein
LIDLALVVRETIPGRPESRSKVDIVEKVVLLLRNETIVAENAYETEGDGAEEERHFNSDMK